MSHPWEKSLFQSAVLTFEDLGFLLPSAKLDERQQQVLMEVGVYVDFHGPFNGRILLKISSDLLPVLAANMLGQEDLPSIDEQKDALGEIANVICGNLLPKIGGPTLVFHIEPPQFVEAVSERAIEERNAVTRVNIGLDDSRAEVLLFTSNRAITA